MEIMSYRNLRAQLTAAEVRAYGLLALGMLFTLGCFAMGCAS